MSERPPRFQQQIQFKEEEMTSLMVLLTCAEMLNRRNCDEELGLPKTK
jgi:hypothetical protein